jgi:hypothetical protein
MNKRFRNEQDLAAIKRRLHVIHWTRENVGILQHTIIGTSEESLVPLDGTFERNSEPTE